MRLSDSSRHALSAVFDPTAWSARTGKLLTGGLPALVTLALVVLIAYQLAGLTWRLVDTPQQAGLSPSAAAGGERVADSTEPASVIAAQVAKLHLFGEPAKVVAVAPPPKTTTETRLRLVLHGVFVGETAGDGAAILSEDGTEQRYYVVGDQLPGGAELAGVEAQHVTLSHRGALEILRFADSKEQARPAVRHGVGTPRTPRTPVDPSLQASIEQIRQKPGQIFKYAHFLPVKNNGKVTGFRVLPKKDRRMYQRLGVKPTDLVTAVNGIPLDGNRQAFNALRELRMTDRLEMSVIRQGRSETLVVDLAN